MPVWTLLYKKSELCTLPHKAYYTYWTISGRIGALKTLGSGWVAFPAAPSPEMMLTVGLLVIFACWLVCEVALLSGTLSRNFGVGICCGCGISIFRRRAFILALSLVVMLIRSFRTLAELGAGSF